MSFQWMILLQSRAWRSLVAAPLMLLCVTIAPANAAETQPPQLPFKEPLFEWQRILADNLDAEITQRHVRDGIVYEHLRYTGDVMDGEPVRIDAICAYPEDGENLPGIFWSQSGMYGATEGMVGLFAKKGYFALNVTLPHDVYDSFAAWDADHPERSNLTRLAHVQMRAITYMTRRAEVDAERLGVAGSSYGGFFATLLAGADPRIKAGASFFAAGNVHLGTLRPQFLKLESEQAIRTWRETIDPAWRLKHRDVPFLWAGAANDHWDYIPALVQTYRDSIGDKRICFIPYWAHGLPANVDQQIFDWFDIYLTETREPYNDVSPLELEVVDGELRGQWNWQGANEVAKAELIYSFGPNAPWRGQWVHRIHQAVPATRDGDAAWANVPVPDPNLPVLVYGNITDVNGVVISTVPVTIVPRDMGIEQPTGRPEMAGVPYGDFDEAGLRYLRRIGEPFGTPDETEVLVGEASIRVDPPDNPAQARPTLQHKLFHVPGQSHRLEFSIKAEMNTSVRVAVPSVAPANWDQPAVQLLEPAAAALYGESDHAFSPEVAARVDVSVGTDWQQVTLDVPAPDHPIEGYNLVFQQLDQAPTPYWIDRIRFYPVWDDTE